MRSRDRESEEPCLHLLLLVVPLLSCSRPTRHWSTMARTHPWLCNNLDSLPVMAKAAHRCCQALPSTMRSWLPSRRVTARSLRAAHSSWRRSKAQRQLRKRRSISVKYCCTTRPETCAEECEKSSELRERARSRKVHSRDNRNYCSDGRRRQQACRRCRAHRAPLRCERRGGA